MKPVGNAIYDAPSEIAVQQATRLWTPSGLVDFGGTAAPNPAAMSLLCVRGKLRVTYVAPYMLETSGDTEGAYELSLKVKFKVESTRSLFEGLDF